MTSEELWNTIKSCEGETILTVKKLPFVYWIKGGELFTDRKKKSITKATVEKAYRKVVEDKEHKITGPKALNCFGAPYIWAIFMKLGIIDSKDKTRRN